MNCQQCGAPLEPNATRCKYCGSPVSQQVQQPPQQTYQQPPQQTYQRPPYQQQTPPPPPYQNYYNNPNARMMADGINPAWPVKSKVAAGLLALFLGGLGIHKFYLGKTGAGVVYLLFCWTGVPAVIAFIEGIVYLASNDHNFQVNNQVRLQ